MNKQISPIELSRVYHCNRSTLFLWLTDGVYIEGYMGEPGRIGPNPGGKIELFDGWVTGTVKTWSPPQKVIFTWNPAEWNGRFADQSLVTYELIEEGPDSTRLTIIHEGFPDIEERNQHEQGWVDYVLDPMEEVMGPG